MQTPAKIALVAAAGALAALAAVPVRGLLQSNGEPRSQGRELVEQGSSHLVNGITLTLVAASFSGTETILNLRATGESGEALQWTLAPGAVSHPLAIRPGSTAGQRTANGSVVVETAPLQAFALGPVVIDQIQVAGPTGARRVSGPWTLPLRAPDARRFGTLMRTEICASGELAIGNQNVTVNCTRSTTRTIVEYTPVSLGEELSPPKLVMSSGEVQLPLEYGPAGGLRRAVFASTGFGTELTVSFGPFAAPQKGQVAPVEVRLRQLLADNGRDSNSSFDRVEVTAAHTSGAPGVVVGVGLGLDNHQPTGVPMQQFPGRSNPSGRMRVLRVYLEGTWPTIDDPASSSPYTSTPMVLDAAGTPMRALSGSSGFRKDPSGNISEGESSVDVWLEDGMPIDHVTVVLGEPSRVIRGNWSLTLRPLK